MSAASPAPLPLPDPDASPAPYPFGAWRLADLPVAARPRPALTVAGRPGTVDAGPAGPARGSRDARLRVRLVPRVEPPAASLRADSPAHERPPVLGTPAALTRHRPRGRGAEPDGHPSTADGPLPDPTRMCCAVVQAAVEGLRGVRPLAQLTRWVTPEVYDLLALRARLVQGATTAPSPARAGIRRVRVFRIGDAAAEATVVVDDGPRVRAVAVRVEEHRGRWRATALEIG